MTSGSRVLIIDDDADFADGLGDVLTLLGHTPEIAVSGEQGLSMAESSRFDAAFVDVGLPNINGVECVRMLKARQNGMRCVLMTGYGREWLRSLDVDSAGAPVLTKPVRIEDITAFLAP